MRRSRSKQGEGGGEGTRGGSIEETWILRVPNEEVGEVGDEAAGLLEVSWVLVGPCCELVASSLKATELRVSKSSNGSD